jgi:hypothetical protein
MVSITSPLRQFELTDPKSVMVHTVSLHLELCVSLNLLAVTVTPNEHLEVAYAEQTWKKKVPGRISWLGRWGVPGAVQLQLRACGLRFLGRGVIDDEHSTDHENKLSADNGSLPPSLRVRVALPLELAGRVIVLNDPLLWSFRMTTRPRGGNTRNCR